MSEGLASSTLALDQLESIRSVKDSFEMLQILVSVGPTKRVLDIITPSRLDHDLPRHSDFLHQFLKIASRARIIRYDLKTNSRSLRIFDHRRIAAQLPRVVRPKLQTKTSRKL